MNEEKGQENLMMSLQNPETEQQPVSRRGFAKVAVAALAVAGFGTAALNGALARHGADDGGGGSSGGGSGRRRRRHGRRRHSGRHS
jgi:hypothetical protein